MLSESASGVWSSAKIRAKGNRPEVATEEEELPNNVKSKSDLVGLPGKFLSGDSKRPLRSWDEAGKAYLHALVPMTYSVIFILLVEALERFSYYGVSFTQNQYLQNGYDSSGYDWGPNMTTTKAQSYVSTSTAITYTSPFIGGLIADMLLGDYFTITTFALLFYIPGLILIALTASPGLLGDTFNTTALTVGLLVLYPLGAGGIKSIVNVFGAKQYHPVLQSAQVETYYVRFYTAINIGALVGGLTIPPLCQKVGPFTAYLVPVGALSFGMLVFLLFTTRYVRTAPSGKTMVNTVKVLGAGSAKCSLDRVKVSHGGRYEDNLVDGVRQLGSVLMVSALVIPFNVVYAQMGTTFNTQGMAMQTVGGFIDASFMQNADAISVLLFGFLVSTFLYPNLANKGMRIPTAYKFAIGSFFGMCSVVCAVIVDSQIAAKWNASGTQLNILWQIPQFMFIGVGEIFAVSAAYEAAFNIAPKEQKAFASAINLFCIGGIPNFISSALYNACSDWFLTSTGATHLAGTGDYVDTQYTKFFWLLFGIQVFGVLLNLIPPIKKWVQKTEDTARYLADVSAHSANDSKHNITRVEAV